jgi:hypothetical protein
MVWHRIDSYNVYIDGSYKELRVKKDANVAIFDLVGTLIVSKNGSLLQYDTNPKNYQLLGEETIKKTLEKLNEKYIIIIMCKNDYYKRCVNVQKEMEKLLGFSPIFIQSNKGGIGYVLKGFDIVKSILNIEFNTENSFICGDEIGKNDIYPAYRLGDIDTRLSKILNLQLFRPIDILGVKTLEPKPYQELILTMGNPGSGKSTSAQILINDSFNSVDGRESRLFNSVIACDTDEMPNYERRLTMECARSNLLKGHSVIVLANNASRQERADYISIAKELNVPVRVAWFIRDGRPFNFYRGKDLPSNYDKTRVSPDSLPSTHYHTKPVPLRVYDVYTQKFEEPTLKEVNEINLIY